MFVLKMDELGSYIKRHYKSLVPFLNASKLLNILLSVFEMKLRRTTCLSRPFIFRIDPCSACNLRCVSCISHKTKTKEKRVMDLEDLKIIVTRIKKHAIRASLYDMGEPLLNKDIYKMIKYTADLNISTLISTNFNLFNEEYIDTLFNSRLTVLEPCLDGFTQESYEKYRKQGFVDIVKKGIQLVMEEKYKRKSKWPYVDVQVVLFDHIMHELQEIDHFLKQCKVDKITYREENLGFNSQETTIKNKIGERDYCYWLYIGMMIRPDGNVYPCCGRGFDRFPYGNLFEQDISGIWNNKYYRFSRALFTQGPNFTYDEDMSKIPCLSCKQFRKHRIMMKKKPY